MQDHVKKCLERTEEHIKWLLDLEERPATLNTHYLSDYRDKFFAYYKAARATDRNPLVQEMITSYSSSSLVPSLFGKKPEIQHGATVKANVSPFGGGEIPGPIGVAKVLQGLIEVGIPNVKPEDIPKLLPLDPMEPALGIMADVRAYFQGS